MRKLWRKHSLSAFGKAKVFDHGIQDVLDCFSLVKSKGRPLPISPQSWVLVNPNPWKCMDVFSLQNSFFLAKMKWTIRRFICIDWYVNFSSNSFYFLFFSWKNRLVRQDFIGETTWGVRNDFNSVELHVAMFVWECQLYSNPALCFLARWKMVQVNTTKKRKAHAKICENTCYVSV